MSADEATPPPAPPVTDTQHSHPARRDEDRRLKDNLDADTRKQIGRKGGAAVSRDRSHMAEIGRRGGQAVARNPQHMADIGRRGGAAVSRDRAHMAAIGRRGGAARGAHKMGAGQPDQAAHPAVQPAHGAPTPAQAGATPTVRAGLTQPSPPPKGEPIAVGQAQREEDEE